jgi:hypothetical protein
MDGQVNPSNLVAFNEEEWLRILFLLNDTQHWLDDLVKNTVMQVPVTDRKKLFRKTYYITIGALTHILERHYYKILRYPQAGKFTIPIPAILSYLREASQKATASVPGTLNFQRQIQAEEIIGFDFKQTPTNIITIITDSGGRIITAFPGHDKNISIDNPKNETL